MRSLLERQRISNEAVGTLDAIAVAAEGTDANAQVFQVRDGVLADRQSFYLENAAPRDESEVAEEFVLQYYASALAIPPQVIVPRALVERTGTLAEALAERRGAPVEVRHAERGDKRRILELAERNARLALDQDRLRSERRRSQRIEALDGLQRALGMEAIPMRIECFDISNLMGDAHGGLDGRVRGRRAEEVRLPPLRDPEAAFRTTSPRWRRCSRAGWPSTSRSASAPRTTRTSTRASPSRARR